MLMTLTEYRTEPDAIGIAGGRCGDDAVPAAVGCRAFVSTNTDTGHGRRLSPTHRVRYRLIRRRVRVISRRHITAGEHHEWIHLTRRRGERQWTRTTAAAAGFGCPPGRCGCHTGSPTQAGRR